MNDKCLKQKRKEKEKNFEIIKKNQKFFCNFLYCVVFKRKRFEKIEKKN